MLKEASNKNKMVVGFCVFFARTFRVVPVVPACKVVEPVPVERVVDAVPVERVVEEVPVDNVVLSVPVERVVLSVPDSSKFGSDSGSDFG